MINRSITPKIIKYLKNFPAVAIIGSRQTGKTTLARHLQTKSGKETVYLDLERLEDLMKLDVPAAFLEKRKDECVILDEIQRRPEIFPELRSLIDRHRIPGRFLILGSASPELIRQSSESLAGRITYVELTPLNILETEPDDPGRLWLLGGYPEPYLCEDDEIRKIWYQSFVLTFIERDLPLLGLNTSSIHLMKFLNILAGIQGGILNNQMLSRSLGVSSTTTNRYLDYFEKSFLIRRLLPFHANVKKRLVKSPKIYIRDTGIFHSLTGIDNNNKLWNSIHLGVSWVTFVNEQIITNLEIGLSAWFYRTHEGTECDLVICANNQPIACVESKISPSPSKTRSLTLAILDLKTKYNFIIIPDCPEEYPLGEHIKVCSLNTFIKNHLPEIG